MANKHIMIDLETLGTTSSSVFISIGAVEFDIETGRLGKEFYCNVSVESSSLLGRTKDPATLAWWEKQGDAAKKVLYKNEICITEALANLRTFIKSLGGKKIVWANSPSFDLSMLAHAFSQVELSVPWQFWNQRDCRTIKYLGEDLVDKSIFDFPSSATPHYALDDAKHQATYVSKLFMAMKGIK